MSAEKRSQKKDDSGFVQEYLYIEDYYIYMPIKKEKSSDESARVVELDIFGNNEEKDDIFI